MALGSCFWHILRTRSSTSHHAALDITHVLLGPEVVGCQLGIVNLHHQPAVLRLAAENLHRVDGDIGYVIPCQLLCVLPDLRYASRIHSQTIVWEPEALRGSVTRMPERKCVIWVWPWLPLF